MSMLMMILIIGPKVLVSFKRKKIFNQKSPVTTARSMSNLNVSV